jgi:hypothetical protein
MFRPYLAIFRRIFIFSNCWPAVDRKSMYFMLLHIVVRTKFCLFENKTLYPFCFIFLLRRPCFATSVCMFSLVGLMSLVYNYIAIVNLHTEQFTAAHTNSS